MSNNMVHRSFRLASIAVGLACAGNLYNSRHFVLSGHFIPIIDLLSHYLSVSHTVGLLCSLAWLYQFSHRFQLLVG